MGIFDKIKSAIWGDDEAAAPEVRTASAAPAQPSRTSAATATAPTPIAAQTAAPSTPPSKTPSPAPSVPPSTAQSPAAVNAPAVAPATPASTSTQNVDVASILDNAVKGHGQKLQWRTSIVDTMKALNLDSSLAARKELADELGYTGDKNDSASMNVWLQKALMKKLAENGGKVPAELTD